MLFIAKRIWTDIIDTEILTRASAIAFGAMMAAVPFLALVLTIAALLLPDPAAQASISTLEKLLGNTFPAEAHQVIQEQIARLQTNQPIAVLTVSLGITIWLASGLYAAIIDGLNRIYGIKDTRPYWKFRLQAIWMTIGQSVILLTAVGLAFSLPLAVEWVGFTVQSHWIASMLTWLIIFVMILASFALTFAAGPNVEQAHRWVTPGSVFGTIIFLASTYGFRLYVQNLAHYDVTYGSLGGIVMLLFWFYISSLVLLLAGEVNKVFHYAQQLTNADEELKPACERQSADTAATQSPLVSAPETVKGILCPNCGSRKFHSKIA